MTTLQAFTATRGCTTSSGDVSVGRQVAAALRELFPSGASPPLSVPDVARRLPDDVMEALDGASLRDVIVRDPSISAAFEVVADSTTQRPMVRPRRFDGPAETGRQAASSTAAPNAAAELCEALIHICCHVPAAAISSGLTAPRIDIGRVVAAALDGPNTSDWTVNARWVLSRLQDANCGLERGLRERVLNTVVHHRSVGRAVAACGAGFAFTAANDSLVIRDPAVRARVVDARRRALAPLLGAVPSFAVPLAALVQSGAALPAAASRVLSGNPAGVAQVTEFIAACERAYHAPLPPAQRAWLKYMHSAPQLFDVAFFDDTRRPLRAAVLDAIQDEQTGAQGKRKKKTKAEPAPLPPVPGEVDMWAAAVEAPVVVNPAATPAPLPPSADSDPLSPYDPAALPPTEELKLSIYVRVNSAFRDAAIDPTNIDGCLGGAAVDEYDAYRLARYLSCDRWSTMSELELTARSSLRWDTSHVAASFPEMFQLHSARSAGVAREGGLFVADAVRFVLHASMLPDAKPDIETATLQARIDELTLRIKAAPRDRRKYQEQRRVYKSALLARAQPRGNVFMHPLVFAMGVYDALPPLPQDAAAADAALLVASKASGLSIDEMEEAVEAQAARAGYVPLDRIGPLLAPRLQDAPEHTGGAVSLSMRTFAKYPQLFDVRELSATNFFLRRCEGTADGGAAAATGEDVDVGADGTQLPPPPPSSSRSVRHDPVLSLPADECARLTLQFAARHRCRHSTPLAVFTLPGLLGRSLYQACTLLHGWPAVAAASGGTIEYMVRHGEHTSNAIRFVGSEAARLLQPPLTAEEAAAARERRERVKKDAAARREALDAALHYSKGK